MAFKMKGPSLYKNGASLKVQKDYAGQADGRATSSPFQQKEDKKEEKNEWGETPEQYKKRMEEMGLRKPEKKEDKPPLKQRLTKGGEGQDENKIFNNKGKHVGNYVNGKKVMLKAAKENAAELTGELAMNAERKKLKPKNK